MTINIDKSKAVSYVYFLNGGKSQDTVMSLWELQVNYNLKPAFSSLSVGTEKVLQIEMSLWISSFSSSLGEDTTYFQTRDYVSTYSLIYLKYDMSHLCSLKLWICSKWRKILWINKCMNIIRFHIFISVVIF